MTDIRYTKDHEWVRLEGQTATVGITAHAQESLGDIVFVELPEPGRDVVAGEAAAVVESVKAASDIYAPLAGRVVAANAAVAADPASVNGSAETDGWFFKIEVADRGEFDALLDRASYDALVDAA